MGDIVVLFPPPKRREDEEEANKEEEEEEWWFSVPFSWGLEDIGGEPGGPGKGKGIDFELPDRPELELFKLFSCEFDADRTASMAFEADQSNSSQKLRMFNTGFRTVYGVDSESASSTVLNV
jgi:hypothetical protein